MNEVVINFFSFGLECYIAAQNEKRIRMRNSL
jgi:hypothetical protein